MSAPDELAVTGLECWAHHGVFEHERREEVIQYIYGKYGRHRAALTAVVIRYRPRSALRDMGRALGIDLQRIEAVAKGHKWFDGRSIATDRLRENGFELLDLKELYAPEDAVDHQYYDTVPASWAKRWPDEEIWHARLRA